MHVKDVAWLLMTLRRCGEATLAKAARSLGQNIHRIW